MRTLKHLSLIVTAAVLLNACSSVKLDDNAPIEDRSGAGAASNLDTRNVAPVNTGSTDALNDPQSVLAQRSIYFDLDSYAIGEDYRSLIAAHARYLNAHKDRKIVIQGNTDERGGSEYNLALGQKRAEAVRRAFALLGVEETQMEAVSFGKEKPNSTGSDETSWADNRRADIRY